MKVMTLRWCNDDSSSEDDLKNLVPGDEKASMDARDLCRSRLSGDEVRPGTLVGGSELNGLPMIDLDNVNTNITRLTDGQTISGENGHKFYLGLEHPDSETATLRMKSKALKMSPNSPATKLLLDEVPLPIAIDILNTDSRKSFNEL